MKRILFALALSVALHAAAFAGFTAIQLLSPPPKKPPMKILYIKPVTIPKSEIKKVEIPKTTPKVEPAVPKNVTPPKSVEKIAINPKPTPNIPNPGVTPKPVRSTPEPFKTIPPIVFDDDQPKNTKVAENPKKLTPAQIKEEQDKKKIAVLRTHPYFKNWSDARIKRLELPPGINSWDEAKKLTEFFDTQYKWTYAPPELGDGKGKNPDVNPYESKEPETQNTPIPENSPSEPSPSPDDITPEWKEFKEKGKDYSIRFYKDNIGFIAYFKEEERKVEISYFPFTPDPNKEIEVKIPDNTKIEDVKSFNLPLTKEDIESRTNPEKDKMSKDQLVRDIIRTYNQQKP